MNPITNYSTRQAEAYLYQQHGPPETKSHGEWIKLSKLALRTWKQGVDSIPGRRACVDLAYYSTAARYLKTKRKDYLWLCENMRYPEDIMR